jgi:hypothetical protein
MRRALLLLALSGCSAVNLGEEPDTDQPRKDEPGRVADVDDGEAARLDAGGAWALDAAASGPEALVTVRVGERCNCLELLGEGRGGRAPYTFEWDNGSRDARRVFCPDGADNSVSLTVRDADHLPSAPYVMQLETNDAGCPPAPSLCLQNRSFEGTPAVNTGLPTSFDATPWSVCTNPSTGNTPEVLNESISAVVTIIPKASHGKTYLALLENEQVSQKLCQAIPGGSSVSLKLDLSRINLAMGVVPDTEPVFLEIWGGIAADCSQRELLWATPPLTDGWKTHCITLRPQQFTDNLTLRGRSDESLPTMGYVIVDNLVPVDHCP